MTLPTCYTPHRLSLLDKLVGDDFDSIFILIQIFFNHCFAKADFLIVRNYNNSVQLLQFYGRTRNINVALTPLSFEYLFQHNCTPLEHSRHSAENLIAHHAHIQEQHTAKEQKGKLADFGRPLHSKPF